MSEASMTVLPADRVIRVEFLVALPAAATRAEVLAWLQYEFGWRGDMRMDNPLSCHEAEACSDPVLTDTGKRRCESRTDAPGAIRVTEWLEPDGRRP